MSGYGSGSGEVRETSNMVLERLGCILCVCEFLRWGQKQEKTWVNLKRRYTCVSLISLSAQGGGGGGVRVMSIQKKVDTHAQIPLDKPACTPIGPVLLACGCMH